jgi:hypothetical protein
MSPTQELEIPRASKSAAKPAQSWTCERCEVTVRWMPGMDAPKLPSGWDESRSGTFCLVCRRALAAEAALDNAPAKTTAEQRAKLRATALIEFEIRRDPDRGNGEIARACRSSIPAVAKARRRLGVPEPVR